MSTTKITMQKPSKAYRSTEEYVAAGRHHRRGFIRLLLSIVAIVVPFLYFAAAARVEQRFYPGGELTIGFYVFMLGIVGAAVVIPLVIRLLQCPFTYWKLFLGIVVSLGFGYLASILLFRWTSIESDALLTGKIIAAVQMVVCTAFVVVGVNRNLWSQMHDSKQKKEIMYAYQRFELATSQDPVDILTVHTLAESDYTFAVKYMNEKVAADALYRTSKDGFAAGSIPADEYGDLVRAAAENGSRDAAVECATDYVKRTESDLVKMSAGDKTHATAIYKVLEKAAAEDETLRPITAILLARLRSSMILTGESTEENTAMLLESTQALKELVEGGKLTGELAGAANTALGYAEEAVQRSIQYQNPEV